MQATCSGCNYDTGIFNSGKGLVEKIKKDGGRLVIKNSKRIPNYYIVCPQCEAKLQQK